MKLNYFLLIVLTGIAGAASGILWLFPNGMMAAALGMSLSLGTIWLGCKEQKNGSINLTDVFKAGLGSGILASVSMVLTQWACTFPRIKDPELDFGPPMLPIWVPLVLGIAYGLFFHWGYYQRKNSFFPLCWTLFCTVGGSFLLRSGSVWAYRGLTQHYFNPTEAVMLSLLGAVPFSLFWILLTAAFDPAWSPERLERFRSVGTERTTL